MRKASCTAVSQAGPGAIAQFRSNVVFKLSRPITD